MEFFTDDTILTDAIADALLSVGNDATIEQIEKSCAASMQKWGNQYNAGYGARFKVKMPNHTTVGATDQP